MRLISYVLSDKLLDPPIAGDDRQGGALMLRALTVFRHLRSRGLTVVPTTTLHAALDRDPRASDWMGTRQAPSRVLRYYAGKFVQAGLIRIDAVEMAEKPLSLKDGKFIEETMLDS